MSRRWWFEIELGHKAILEHELGSVNISTLQKQIIFPLGFPQQAKEWVGQMPACLQACWHIQRIDFKAYEVWAWKQMEEKDISPVFIVSNKECRVRSALGSISLTVKS